MAYRGGPTDHRPTRDPRLHRQYGYEACPGGRVAVRGQGGLQGGFDGHPPPVHRPHPPPPPTAPPVVGGMVRREQFDYFHKRDRSRSPYAQRDSDCGATKQHCDINALLRDESIQITVGNDKFRNPQHTRSGVHSSSVDQDAAVLPTGRTSVHHQQEYAEETASVARAKEMAMRTREMLSKLTGWNPISLRPTTSLENSAKTGDRSNVVNASNSSYTKLSASSEVAQTILRNINAVAAAFCPKESGGVTHIKYTDPGGSKKVTNEDEDRFLYGEELVPNSLEKSFSHSSAIKSVFGEQKQPSITGPPVKDKETESGCDPVVANVLKSIGFNFELSKIMQEKAKKEREENEKNRLLIQQASSFLAKQLGKANALRGESLEPLETRTSDTINKDVKPGGIVVDGSKERKKILYDDFSSSEDEFCKTEIVTKVATSLDDSNLKPPVASTWSSSSVGVSMPLNLNFPPPVPLSASVLPTPPVVHPMSSIVPPPPITIPPPQMLLPPSALPPQSLTQRPMWPGYQMPPAASNAVAKKRTDPQPCSEEWEQNTEDFLRRLQEPRTADEPSKRDAKPLSRSSSPSSSDSERVDKRKRTPTKRSKRNFRKTSESPEQVKRRKYSGRDSDGRYEDDNDSGRRENAVRRLASLREKLKSMKMEHNNMLRIRQKSNYIKDKLARSTRLQHKLMDEIEELKRIARRGDQHSVTASDDESLADHTRRRRDSAEGSQTRLSDRRSRELSRERDRKPSRVKESSPGRDQRRCPSRPWMARRSVDKQQKSSTSMEPGKKLHHDDVSEVKDELNSCDRNEMAVQVKEEVGGQEIGNEVKQETDGNAAKINPEDSGKKSEIQKLKKLRYDYYDGGDNWCSVCSERFPKLVEFLDHLHGEAHDKQAVKQKASIGRPWSSCRSSQPKPHTSIPPVSVPASGMEFMKPIRGFFCALCNQFAGDCEDAEFHVLSEEHNSKFKEHCLANPSYLNDFSFVKAAKMTGKKNETGKITDAACNDEPNRSSKIISDELESTVKKRGKQSAAKTTSIPVKPLGNVAVGKVPHLRSKKELNLNQNEITADGLGKVKEGSESSDDMSSSEGQKLSDDHQWSSVVLSAADSKTEVTNENGHLLNLPTEASDDSDMKDAGCQEATSSRLKAASLGLNVLFSSEESVSGDAEMMLISPRDGVWSTAEPSKDEGVSFQVGPRCSLVPYEDPDDNDVDADDLETMSIEEQLSGECMRENSEIGSEEKPTSLVSDIISDIVSDIISDVVNQVPENSAAPNNICSLDSHSILPVENKESTVCLLEEPALVNKKAETCLGHREICVAKRDESFETKDFVHDETVDSIGSTQPLADEGSRGPCEVDPSVSETAVRSQAVKRLHNECLGTHQSLESSSVEGDKDPLIMELPSSEQFESGQTAESVFTGAVEDSPTLRSHLAGTLESSVMVDPSSTETEMVESYTAETAESCESVKSSAVNRFANFHRSASSGVEANESCRTLEECPGLDRERTTDANSIEQCDFLKISNATVGPVNSSGDQKVIECKNYLTDVTCESESITEVHEIESIKSETTDDYAVQIDDEDTIDAPLETDAEVSVGPTTDASIRGEDMCLSMSVINEKVIVSSVNSGSREKVCDAPLVDITSDSVCGNSSLDFTADKTESKTESSFDVNSKLNHLEELRSEVMTDENQSHHREDNTGNC